MEIIGYTNRLSVAPGERIQFYVSSREPRYEAKLVRLIHGDENPLGPGFKEEEIKSPIDGEYHGREQVIPSGSYAYVEGLELGERFAFEAWIYPTTPDLGSQGILTLGAVGLGIGENGDLELRVSDTRVGTGVPLRASTWYRTRGEFDSGRVLVEQEPLPRLPREQTAAVAEGQAPWHRASGRLVMAGWLDGDCVQRHFNGKIDSPRVFAGDDLVGAWDLALHEPGSMEIHDTGPRGLHGRCVNTPLRGVPGVRWTGDEHDWRRASEEYSAIHFHDDDLEDARWEPDFELQVPDSLCSGIYAARLGTVSGAEDYLPFVVRPRRGESGSRVAMLLPTLSYLAYGSEHMVLAAPTLPEFDHSTPPVDLDIYSFEHKLRSLYDLHTDGRGVALATLLRPLTNLRPKYVMPAIGFVHQFNADLHLIDWLDAKGHEVDFITDLDLHHEGLELLRPYRVVMTGSHPEYWTRQMLDALDAYVGDGGRFMYLGGNGLYWVTGIDPQRPHVIEVRRGQRGTGTWTSEEGENHLQTTGERGGLWRERNRAPQRYVGVGMAAQGFDEALPYVRQEGSFDPRAAWIFDGVDEDPIGGYGLCIGGAGGFEIDRFDNALGTPQHALLLAAATGFSDNYQHVIEEVGMANSLQGGSVEPRVRADMTFLETPNGGAVFSVGSICWCGSLSWNGYENGVSRITDNVLRRFAADDPF